ncbi:Crp/Fnr family transcriptional regulator [Marinobacter sp. chi1]|uniref:Crp/Fnr family transcriptional regulator n=1 Tax=Marinobacter suaedae TaxID=3057675 RepID=A0ABT8W0B9_9GAMM|nr:Crp/Fnr family transcriptional regulator [Marinobacter sp. chi1]MDO3721660.1 Crp/Fnr family transcriptional regulator [Marinobacter sp. chi1]
MSETSQILSRCALFAGFPPEGLEEAASLCTYKSFHEEQALYIKGASGKALTVIVSGSVRVTSTLPSGRESILTIVGAGNWLGDAVFCSLPARVYGAIAHEPVEVLEFSEAQVHRLLATYPQAYPVIVDQLARRMCAAMMIIEDDTARSIPVRVGRRLLFLQIFQGDGKITEQPMRLRLTREQVGNMVGLTRQAAQKAIRVFEQENLVSLEYGTITLTNPARFETFLTGLDE